MEARYTNAACAGELSAEDTIPTWGGVRFEASPPGSSPRLAADPPTVPPPPPSSGADVMVSKIHLGPSVDEVLYRLSLGDVSGAALANEELEPFVPVPRVPPVVLLAMELSYLEGYLLAKLDGSATWGEVLDNSPFAPKETLKALCDLVDKGAVTLIPA